MLQHNTGNGAGNAGGKAHMAHAAMAALHFLCCGLPIVALAVVALSGATSGATAFAASTGQVHGALHSHELWILAGSAFLVVVGGGFELAARKVDPGRGLPVMFLVSLGCFALNLALILSHRGL